MASSASLFSSAQSPSSSSSTARRWKHDVFLSFRGSDTRRSITNDMYERLQNRGIKTFKDDPDLKVGDAISRTLIEAIEQSRFAVVVLSRDYASSTWCLEELAKICECMKENNRILPLFYNMEPSEVRHQLGSFKEAFDKHESAGRHTSDKVRQWRDALKKVANFSGWDTNNIKTDKELVEKIVDYVCERIQPSDTESTMCTEDFEPYEATRKAMGEVMKALKDDKVTAVGVFGMGGVGKTTMVQEVAAQSKKSGIFNFVITLVVSQSPDLRLIQGTLADMLGVTLSEETGFGRAARLNRELMRREKILIILDDVWKRIELSSIGIPSHEQLQRCHSKVILTTRRKYVCHDMKCQEKIALDILSKEDSWTLFVRSARRSLESTTFDGVAKKVVGECRGLPIALIAVARALGDKDHAEWEKAARRLEKSQSAIVEDEQEAFVCIKLSFDYLKDEDSKSCLLLCCLFPEDHEIGIEDLLRYAVRTIFFQDAETIEEARGTLVSVVKYLKDSSLLLDSHKNGCVKMHDVIRDTAIQIAESEHGFRVKVGFGLKDWPRGLDEGCTAISLMRNEICKLPEQQLVCPHLQILLLNRNADLDEIPEKFVESLSELRVLDISNTSISILPQSFSLLTNLQALYLDGWYELIDISVVGKLKKLEILSMREYPKGKLPREIGHLTNLRILDVNRISSDSGVVIIPSKMISKLHKLEELYMVYCWFEDWTSCFGELAGLSYLRKLQLRVPYQECIPENVEAKPNWEYFSIRIIGRWKNIVFDSDDFELDNHTDLGDCNSRSLFLNGTIISILPDWFANAVTEKLEKLEYCGGMSDILMEHDHGRLHELKHLSVCGCFNGDNVNLKELMNTTGRVQKEPVFEKLEELHLLELKHLEELCVGELSPGSLFNLKVLHMFLCRKLKNVSKFVQRLPSLERLVLSKMDELEYVIGCQGSELKESKLREVHNLLGPNSVKSICRGPVATRVMFQSIKILTIYRCELLQSLFASSDVAQCLSQLEDLFVESCPLLERVIKAVNSEKAVLPKLKNLVLKNLPVLYGASSTVDIECPSLEHLIMMDCPNISVSTSNNDLFESSESRNWFSVSDYFGSSNPVQLNDGELYYSLRRKYNIDREDY